MRHWVRQGDNGVRLISEILAYGSAAGLRVRGSRTWCVSVVVVQLPESVVVCRHQVCQQISEILICQSAIEVRLCRRLHAAVMLSDV